MYITKFRRYTMLATSIICIVPCFLSLFVYGLQSPVYRAETWGSLFENAAESQENNEGDCYQGNTELWLSLEEEAWEKQLSIQEKINIMQELVDFETSELGIPSVPVAAGMVGKFTLGTHNNSESVEIIFINTEHLANSTARGCIQTICHEVYHSLQDYILAKVDLDNPALQTAYFEELRSWAQNQYDYKDVWNCGFSTYKNQPLEISARNYAAQETAKIMAHIKSAVGKQALK